MSDTDLQDRLAELEARVNDLTLNMALASDLDTIWIIISAVLVFFMQVGFAMLEVGSVHSKNTKAVLLKNIGDASLGALCWWLVGFALAYGKDKHGIVGTDLFALKGDGVFETPGIKEAEWMFDWAFAATSVTIVSGAIAERVKIAAYVVYAIALTSFIYPLVVHWAWHTDGWASPYREAGAGRPLLANCGAADFAGSGVVHMVGGTAALIAAIAVKPRLGRFRNGMVCKMSQQSPALQTLGTLILWVGWYAFNAGSSVTVSNGRSAVAARAVVSTTIGPSAAVLVMVISLKILEKKFDTRGVNNGILSGLVAITAGAPLLNPEGAFVIGVVSAGVYYCSAALLLRYRVDDVVDAAPVHLFCGIWGMIATGLFTTREGWKLTYGERGGDRADDCCGLFYGCGFNLLFANLALAASILAWVGGASIILFFTIEVTVGLRVPQGEEETGMDRTRHSSLTQGFHKPDAVRRAFTKAHLGVDDSSYGVLPSRSQQSSRAASLSTSKHGDMAATAAGAISNGKHEPAWGGAQVSHDSRLDHRPMASANLFDRHKRMRGDGPALAQYRSHSTVSMASGGGPAMAADAVTPSVGRGTAYGFNGQFGGGSAEWGVEQHGGGGVVSKTGGPGNANSEHIGYLGAPAPPPLPAPAQILGKPKWRRSKVGNVEEWVRHEEEVKKPETNVL